MASIAVQLAVLYFCGQRGKTRIDFVVHTRICTARRGVDPVIGIYDDERRFINILKALRKTYHKLKRRGIRVSLRLQNVCSVAQTETWDYTSHLIDVLNEERWRQVRTQVLPLRLLYLDIQLRIAEIARMLVITVGVTIFLA